MYIYHRPAAGCNLQPVFCCQPVLPAPRTAAQVLALRQENDHLKATLTEVLNSPLNRELQLPPTLLLR